MQTTHPLRKLSFLQAASTHGFVWCSWQSRLVTSRSRQMLCLCNLTCQPSVPGIWLRMIGLRYVWSMNIGIIESANNWVISSTCLYLGPISACLRSPEVAQCREMDISSGWEAHPSIPNIMAGEALVYGAIWQYGFIHKGVHVRIIQW